MVSIWLQPQKYSQRCKNHPDVGEYFSEGTVSMYTLYKLSFPVVASCRTCVEEQQQIYGDSSTATSIKRKQSTFLPRSRQQLCHGCACWWQCWHCAYPPTWQVYCHRHQDKSYGEENDASWRICGKHVQHDDPPCKLDSHVCMTV